MAGEKLARVGVTMKAVAEVSVPRPLVTVMGPETAAAGTCTVRVVSPVGVA